MKIRERSENSHFQVSVALLGGGPKIFFSKGVALLRGGSRRSLIPLCILWHRKGQPSVGGRGGVQAGGVGSILLYIGELDGDSTLLGGRMKKIGLNRRALPHALPFMEDSAHVPTSGLFLITTRILICC